MLRTCADELQRSEPRHTSTSAWARCCSSRRRRRRLFGSARANPHRDCAGRQPPDPNFLGPGDLFGEVAVLDGQSRTADATAGEPSELFVLRREDFLAFLEREPKVAIKIMMLLCQRIRWQSERMEESVLQPLPVRLARRLCALASDFGSEVHISQEQLGVFVGAARESVNRQLQLWRKDGILDLQRGRILLQNMTKLTAVARNE
jgi:CRP-like cAMP-binding protein